MSGAAKTIRAIYDHGVLRPLDPLPIEDNQTVTLVVLEDDLSSAAMAAVAAGGGAFDFLIDEKEDLYSVHDGEPL